MLGPQETDSPRHPIQVVVRRTGLKPDLIRAWERRYRAVEPARSPSGRRVYSDHDVSRLLLLRQAILGGRRIGDVASLGPEDLSRLVQEDRHAFEDRETSLPASGPLSVNDVVDALRRFDARGVDLVLRRAQEAYGPSGLVHDVLVPFLRQVGEGCKTGALRIYHEHLATVCVRRRLEILMEETRPAEPGPTIVITTPAAQIHELGALMASVLAGARGWEPLFLGVNLPAEEIAAAAATTSARAVALSLVHPPDDLTIPNEVRKLRRILPPPTPLLLGGRAVRSYASQLDLPGIVRLRSLGDFEDTLDRLREG